MNVREDKMNNSLGLKIGKTSLNYCVPVLFRVSRRARRKNILLDVKWVVQLKNYKHDFPHSFRRIKIRDSQSIKERDLFYNFWFISRYSPN